MVIQSESTVGPQEFAVPDKKGPRGLSLLCLLSVLRKHYRLGEHSPSGSSAYNFQIQIIEVCYDTHIHNDTNEETGKDFFSSWKSASVAEDDAVDFTSPPLSKGSKGKQSNSNFDKLGLPT
ncbi:hypothetical protein C5167_007185 [Papaver somniferum]|uniref:Uncharacterized protein n=1 Tax=Papaver somniferum TaxID=3469 RepID=A0A4Y7JIK2_PAPSO|nr:hypothetical protein C5167_007185 [Papaver somniferum]